MRAFVFTALFLATAAIVISRWPFVSERAAAPAVTASSGQENASFGSGMTALAELEPASDLVDRQHLGEPKDELQAGARVPSKGAERRAISYNHPRLVENILGRQSSMEFAMAVLRGEVDPPSSLGESAHSAAQLAVMIDMDAKARSELLDAPKRFEPASPTVHQLVSGGAYYRFAVGEYPAYDKARDLLNEFGKNVPAEQIPIDDILEICAFAQSYSVD